MAVAMRSPGSRGSRKAEKFAHPCVGQASHAATATRAHRNARLVVMRNPPLSHDLKFFRLLLTQLVVKIGLQRRGREGRHRPGLKRLRGRLEERLGVGGTEAGLVELAAR